MAIVLLDTNVAAGVLAGIASVSEEDNQYAQQWETHVSKLVVSSIGDLPIRIPTPAFFELASKNDGMYQALSQYTNTTVVPPDFFQLVKRSISADIAMLAAKYRMTCDKKYGRKVQIVDSFIAAYSVLGGHYLVTTNGDDFHNWAFDAVNISLAPIKTPKQGRTVVYLLKPKVSVHRQSRCFANL